MSMQETTEAEELRATVQIVGELLQDAQDTADRVTMLRRRAMNTFVHMEGQIDLFEPELGRVLSQLLRATAIRVDDLIGS